MSTHINTIKELNRYLNLSSPKKELIDVVRYEDYKNLRLSSPGITFDFYFIAFKRNMMDLQWYGNTEFDPDAGFLYFISPDQLHKWEVTQQWSGYHILISPILAQEYNIDFTFFNYKITEALFLTADEQVRVETLFEQINDEYQRDDYSMEMLLAYCNLFLTYVQKCYTRQFNTRQPLYNKLVKEFKTLLNSYYEDHGHQLPTVNHFANSLNLSPNYFGDVIKHHTGQTTMDLIHEKIIKVAKDKLAHTDSPISQIGYELGFEYPTYFGRLFKKRTNKTPKEYREMIMNKK